MHVSCPLYPTCGTRSVLAFARRSVRWEFTGKLDTLAFYNGRLLFIIKLYEIESMYALYLIASVFLLFKDRRWIHAEIELHFVNAQQDDTEMQQTILITEIIQEIIRYQFKVELKEDLSYFARFVTHLNFFFRCLFFFSSRVLHRRMISQLRVTSGESWG